MIAAEFPEAQWPSAQWSAGQLPTVLLSHAEPSVADLDLLVTEPIVADPPAAEPTGVAELASAEPAVAAPPVAETLLVAAVPLVPAQVMHAESTSPTTPGVPLKRALSWSSAPCSSPWKKQRMVVKEFEFIAPQPSDPVPSNPESTTTGLTTADSIAAIWGGPVRLVTEYVAANSIPADPVVANSTLVKAIFADPTLPKPSLPEPFLAKPRFAETPLLEACFEE